MTDKIASLFNNDEIKIVNKINNTPERYAYLYNTYGHNTYRHDKDEYFPTIIAQPYGIWWETCPAKVLFGHNLYEVRPEHLNKFIDKSIQQLAYAGVYVKKEVLLKHTLNRLDVNKITLLNYSMELCRRLLESSRKSGRQNNSITLYPDTGHAVVSALAHRRLEFYDKYTEGIKQQIPDELKDILNRYRLTIFNIEYQIQGLNEIRREFITQKIPLEPTVENAFNPLIAKTILSNRVSKFFEGIVNIDNPLYDLLEQVELACKEQNITGLQNISVRALLLLLIKEFGAGLTYKWIKQHTDKISCRKYWSMAKNLADNTLKQDKSLGYTILSEIDKMKLVDLQAYKSFIQESILNDTECKGNTTEVKSEDKLYGNNYKLY